MRRAWSWLFLVALMALAVTAEARPLLLGATEDPPLKWLENGQPTGIDIDILALLLPRIGVDDWRFVFFQAGARLQREAETGGIDVMVTVSRTPQREAFLDYPAESHVALDWRFVVRAEDVGRVRFDRLADLRGLAIGVTRGVAYRGDLDGAGLTLLEQADDNHHLPMLLRGRIDVMVMQYLRARWVLRGDPATLARIAFLPKPLRAAPYYNAWSRRSTYPDKDAVRARYDAVLATMKADGTITEQVEHWLR
jgi:polar amino acid transport system substrate-binding protein